MKLISQLKPFSTRADVVRIPPKSVCLVTISEHSKTSFDPIVKYSPLVGSFVGYVPISINGLRVSPDTFKEVRKKFKREIFITDSIFKTQRSIIVDLTSVLNRLERRGIRYPYTSQYKKFTTLCLFNDKLDSLIAPYSYKYIYSIIDLSEVPENISLQTLRYMKIFSVLDNLEDPDWQSKFDSLYSGIITTFIMRTGETITMLTYQPKSPAFGNPNTAKTKLLTLIKYYSRTHKVDDEIDNKVSKIKKNIPKVIHNKQTAAVVNADVDTYASKYPDEIAKTENLNNPTVTKKLAAKAVKAVVTQDDDVPDKSVNSTLEDLTSIQIPPISIPKKETTDDVMSEVRDETYPPQVGNIVESRKIAFKKLDSFVKLYNNYFEKIRFKITNIEKSPVIDNDISASELEKLDITIEDLKLNKEYNIELYIPKIIDNNYFVYKGVKRVLVHQLFPLPVVSYKAGQVIIRTNFANATVLCETKFKVKTFTTIVLGKKVPTILLLILYHKSLGNVLQNFNIDYDVVNTPDVDTYQLTEDQYLKLKNPEPELKILFNGLKIIKYFPKTDSYDDWLKSTSQLISKRFADQIENYFERFIDPLTYYILKTENLPENIDGLLWYACQLAFSGIVTSQTDLRDRRIRSVEVLAILLYKRLYFELFKNRTQTELSYGSTKKSTIKIPKDALLKDLVTTDAQSQFQQLDDINPVSEASYVTRVVYAGYNGVKSENVPMTMRNVDPTYFGTICPVDTPECLDPNTYIYKLGLDSKVKKIKLKDVSIGDKILGKDNFVEVLKKLTRYKDAYKIELEDGTKIICSKDHKFPVYDTRKKKEVLLALKEIMKKLDRYEFIRGNI